MTRESRRGWHQVAPSCFAYLVPEGSWGETNAGLVRSGSDAVLIDTLLTLPHAQRMLDALEAISPGLDIGTVVNTHAHGDHIWGNQLFAGARIISTRTAADEIADEVDPSAYVALLQRSRDGELGALGEWLVDTFGRYDFRGITVTPPDTTFSGEMEVRVGDVELRLIEVGPAHTLGDLIVYVPQDRLAFVGDVVDSHGHPVIWKGSLKDSIETCDRILELDLETIVPGHGPVGGKRDVAAFRHYLEHVDREATARFEAGMPLIDAAADIPCDEFADWPDRERLAITVGAVYRSLGWEGATTQLEQLGQVAELAARYRAAAAGAR